VSDIECPAADQPSDSAEVIKRLTAAMREADRAFGKVGGGTKYHVRDCLLPVLEKHGLKIECCEAKD